MDGCCYADMHDCAFALGDKKNTIARRRPPIYETRTDEMAMVPDTEAKSWLVVLEE